LGVWVATKPPTLVSSNSTTDRAIINNQLSIASDNLSLSATTIK